MLAGKGDGVPPPQPLALEALADSITSLTLNGGGDGHQMSTGNTRSSSSSNWLEVLMMVCVTHICVGFAMGSVSPAMESVTGDFKLSDGWRGALGASALAGNILGSPLGGTIADSQGRKNCILIAWIVLAIATALQGFSYDIKQLCLARAFVGWSVGAHYSGITAYLSEIIPADRSIGTLLSLTELNFFIGNFLSIGVGAGFKYLIQDLSLRWRLTLSISAIPVFAAIIWFAFRAHESDVWLAVNRRRSPTLLEQPEQEAATYDRAKAVSSIIFVSIFWTSLVVPTYAVSAFAVTIIQGLHITVDPFLLNTFLAAAALFGVVLGTATIGLMGKKALLLTSQFGVAFTFIAMACLQPLVNKGTSSGASKALIGTLVFAFLWFEVLNGVGAPLALAYPAEIFPPSIKGLGSGISAMNSRIACVLSIVLMSFTLTRIGIGITLGVLGALSAVAGLCTISMAPKKTKTQPPPNIPYDHPRAEEVHKYLAGATTFQYSLPLLEDPVPRSPWSPS